MKVSYTYPNNKKNKAIKIYSNKGSSFVVLNENGNEISKRISTPLFEQIRKNVIKLLSKKNTEYACPKRIKIVVSLNKNSKVYCKSTESKKNAAKLFRKLYEITTR
tara:strand:+ start:30090 stop:30407 length:318 start_codon:yes stop_codon:yes gene_type:complete